MSTIVWLSGSDEPGGFPPPEQALAEPDGLLAAGGDLKSARLIAAYEQGIFPWYSEGQPVLWWSPNPRTVLFPPEFHVSRSLRKTLRTAGFETRLDTDFAAVIRACSEPRAAADGTWLTPEMIAAYTELHEMGYAHSINLARRPAGGWPLRLVPRPYLLRRVDVQPRIRRVEGGARAAHERSARTRHRAHRLPGRLPSSAITWQPPGIEN